MDYAEVAMFTLLNILTNLLVGNLLYLFFVNAISFSLIWLNL